MDRLENLKNIIMYLMADEHVSHQIPSSLEERQRMMRALMNVWEPRPIAEDFLMKQDVELQMQREDKGVVKVHDEGLTIWQGDITRLKVEAIVTQGYNLPARYVIHTVGPIIPDGVPTKEQEEQLAQCYRSCLDLAEEDGLESIAFCCISTGVFHFPNELAARIAIETVKSYPRHALKTIVFNVFLDKDRNIYQQLLRA